MAVEEMLGRALKKGELEEMMQKKMLDPEVLLPLVGKYFHKLAEDSGALKKKLKQLQAVESRMKESWIQFVNELYNKGVEAALIKVYKGLDRVANSVKQLAGNAIGKFLKGALDMISETALALLDVIQIIVYLIDQAFGSNTDAKAFAAEILGMVVAAAVLAKIFIGIKRTMMAMVGLSTALGLGGGSGKGIGGFIGKVMIIGFASEALSALARRILDIKDNPTKDLHPIEKQAVKSLSRSDEMWWPIKKIDEWLFGSIGRDFVDTASIRKLDKINQIAAGAGGPRSALYTHIPPVQNVNVNITMDKNAKEIIKAEIQQHNQQQVNSLIPPSARSR